MKTPAIHKTTFLLLALLLGLGARLAAVTVTSASIKIQADDRYDVYFNGVYITPHTDPAECFFDSPFYCKQTQVTWPIPASLVDCGDNILSVIVYDIPGGGLFTNYVLTFSYSDGTTEQIFSNSATYNATSHIDTWYAGYQSDTSTAFPLTDPPMQGTLNWTNKGYVPAGASSTMAPCLASQAASVGSWFRAGYDVPGGSVYGPPCCAIVDASGNTTPYIFASDCNSTNQWSTIGLSPPTSTWYFRHSFQLSHGPVCLPTPTPTPVCNYLWDGFPSNGAGLAGNTWRIQTGLQTWDGNWATSDVGNAGWWSVGDPPNPASTDPIVSVKAFVRWRAQKPGPDGHLLFNYCVATNNCTTAAITNVTITNQFEALWESATFTVPPPAGGWTWAKLANMAVYLKNDVQGGGSGSTKVLDVDNLRLIVEFSPSCGTKSYTPSMTPSLSNTPTSTKTFSATPTLTASPTPSATPTATPSATPSPTFSATPTFSPTATATPTATPSPTFTATSTFSPTPTATPTSTATPTFSDSPTPSATRTATPTPTQSFTFTPTPTFSDSPTPSSTPTQSFTFTATPTFSDSPTPSATPTQSFTFTGTKTFTDSPTASSTATPTFSFTATPTFSDSPTASSTLTPSNSFTGTKTLTDSPTPSATVTESDTFTGTRTFTDSATETPSYTDSATATESPSASPTRSATASKTVTFTYSASPTYSPSPTISPTFTPAAPWVLSIKVFNSAGELVAVLAPAMPIYSQLRGVRVLLESFDPDGGGQGLLQLDGPDQLLSWDGRGSAGQVLKSGNYFVLVQQTDPTGAVSSWPSPMTVIRSESGVEIGIYNTAGELVWHRSVALAGSSRMGVSADRLVLGTQPAGSVKISFGQGASDFVAWDGNNDAGLQVATGTYTLRMTQKNLNGDREYFSRSLSVIRIKSENFERVFAWPDPATAADSKVTISFTGTKSGSTAWGEVYDLAGKKVGSLGGDLATGLAWDLSPGQASGIFLVRVTLRSPQGALSSRTLKVAVVR